MNSTRADETQTPHRDSPIYVLVTPARNEEKVIEETIISIVRQTVRPFRWVIVSDGSTDRTDEIVTRHAAAHPWIELVHLPDREERHFAGKIHAFNAGYARLAQLKYDYIGSLDADMTLDEDHFEFLLRKLSENPRLGLTGTAFHEGAAGYDYRFVSIQHVSGACQLFRRECFEDIGGYTPLKSGGVDHVAVLTARMKGWQTRTFTERTARHNRKMGQALHGPIRAKYRVGKLDYALGGHPLWELFRCIYQLSKPPLIIGGLMIFLGYLSCAIVRAERSIPAELVRFRRREQMTRLKRFISGNPQNCEADNDRRSGDVGSFR